MSRSTQLRSDGEKTLTSRLFPEPVCARFVVPSHDVGAAERILRIHMATIHQSSLPRLVGNNQRRTDDAAALASMRSLGPSIVTYLV